jgi:hypothetical protein
MDSSCLCGIIVPSRTASWRPRWTRKSAEWEQELAAIEGELTRMQRPSGRTAMTAEYTLELAKQAENL